jgi:hypothetical protein
LEEVVRKSRKVGKSSTLYSSIEWSDIGRILPIHQWDLEHTQVEEAVTTKLYSQLLDCYTVLGSVVSGKEAKRLYFIPILMAVAYLFKDETESKVLILVEEDVDGA